MASPYRHNSVERYLLFIIILFFFLILLPNLIFSETRRRLQLFRNNPKNESRSEGNRDSQWKISAELSGAFGSPLDNWTENMRRET